MRTLQISQVIIRFFRHSRFVPLFNAFSCKQLKQEKEQKALQDMVAKDVEVEKKEGDKVIKIYIIIYIQGVPKKMSDSDFLVIAASAA